MPLLTFAVLALMLLGTVLGDPKPAPSQDQVTVAPARPRPVALTPELSASMFRGIVQTIDWQALRVTIHTDFGRVVPVAVESCEIIEGLRIGDRVSLAVDAQGIVYAIEAQGPSPSPSSASDLRGPAPRRPDRCQETAT